MNLTDVLIDTKRLRLVPIEYDYQDVIFNNFTSEITEYMYPQPTGKIADTINFITDSLRGLNDGVNLQLVITSKRSGEFLGCVGLHNLNNEMPELGIWVKKSAHNCGYGMEAVNAVIEWGREHLTCEFFKYPVDKSNVKSSRIPIRNNGILMKEYKELNAVGNELDIVEYWIKR